MVLAVKVRLPERKRSAGGGQRSVCNMKRSVREAQRSACRESARQANLIRKRPLGSLRLKTAVRAWGVYIYMFAHYEAKAHMKERVKERVHTRRAEVHV